MIFWIHLECHKERNKTRLHTRAGGVASNLWKSTVCRFPYVIKLLHITHIMPLMKSSAVVWSTGCIGDV